MCIIILGPHHHRWGPLLGLFSYKTRVRAEYARGVIGDHAVVCGVIHHSQMWAMPHITLIKKLDSISICVSSFLGHYNTGEVHCSGSLFQNHDNIWAHLGCSWRSCCDLWGGSPLSHMGYASYNTHTRVVSHIHKCILILGTLLLRCMVQALLFENQGNC